MSLPNVTELIGETCSTLGASSFKNFSTVCCSHSFSETVFFVSLSLLRLICSLHELHLLVKLLTSFSYTRYDHTKAEYIIYYFYPFVKRFLAFFKNIL